MENCELHQKKLRVRRKYCMCIANFFLVTVMVMQIFGLLENSIKVDSAFQALSFANIAFIMGLFFTGPVSAFLVDKFRRQKVYCFSLFVAIAVTAALYFNKTLEFVAIVRFVEGMMFGIAQVALGSTLLNDLAVSEARTSSDYSFAWSAMLAVPAGAGLSCLMVGQLDFDAMLLLSILMLLSSIILVSSLNVPFRAPIHSSVFGLDRFWQKNEYIPFLNLFIISICAGLVMVQLDSLLLYALTVAGVIVAHSVRRTIFRNADVRAEIVTGLVCVSFALLIFLLRDVEVYCRVAAFMFGAGISICSTRFLLYFLKLTGHCQRGTAQNTYMLSRECGYAVGLLLAFVYDRPILLAVVLALVSIALYVFVTHPWFLNHNHRSFKFREV